MAAPDTFVPSTTYDNPQDVAQTIVSARKSWKTVKGKCEAVWPPLLEEALVKALYSYKPEESRSARALGRFPKRNRFISDFIFAETGIRRSPKQVGSRLQQLKDVYCGKQLLSRVAQCPQPLKTVSSQPLGFDNTVPTTRVLPSRLQVDTSFSTIGTPPLSASEYTPSPTEWSDYVPSPLCTPVLPPPQRIDVFIDSSPSWSWPNGQNLDTKPASAPSPLMEFFGSLTQTHSVVPADLYRPLNGLPLRSLDPSVMFRSQEPVVAHSISTVCLDRKAVHQECHPLVCLPRTSDAPDDFLYTTNLTRGFWKELCDDLDVSRYTIVQQVVCNYDGRQQGPPALCIVYHFSSCPSSTPSPVQTPMATFSGSFAVQQLEHAIQIVADESNDGIFSSSALDSYWEAPLGFPGCNAATFVENTQLPLSNFAVATSRGNFPH